MGFGVRPIERADREPMELDIPQRSHIMAWIMRNLVDRTGCHIGRPIGRGLTSHDVLMPAAPIPAAAAPRPDPS